MRCLLESTPVRTGCYPAFRSFANSYLQGAPVRPSEAFLEGEYPLGSFTSSLRLPSANVSTDPRFSYS